MSGNMGQDVFGYKRSPKPRGVFSTEDSKLSFGTVTGEPLGYLVQNWSVSYQQNVQELFEIGTNALYWAKGRPQGNGVLGRVIGDRDADSPSKGFFPKEAYDICDGGAVMKLDAIGGHCAAGVNTTAVEDKQVSIIMSGCVVTQIGFSMQVADVRLMEGFSWRFAYMSLS